MASPAAVIAPPTRNPLVRPPATVPGRPVESHLPDCQSLLRGHRSGRRLHCRLSRRQPLRRGGRSHLRRSPPRAPRGEGRRHFPQPLRPTPHDEVLDVGPGPCTETPDGDAPQPFATVETQRCESHAVEGSFGGNAAPEANAAESVDPRERHAERQTVYSPILGDCGIPVHNDGEPPNVTALRFGQNPEPEKQRGTGSIKEARALRPGEVLRTAETTKQCRVPRWRHLTSTLLLLSTTYWANDRSPERRYGLWVVPPYGRATSYERTCPRPESRL